MSDDECIATALLHGATFIDWREIDGGRYPDHRYGCWNEGGGDDDLLWRDTAGPTKGEAARRYCKRHGLM